MSSQDPFLLRLPYEIRQKIWAPLIAIPDCPIRLHVAIKEKRLIITPCHPHQQDGIVGHDINRWEGRTGNFRTLQERVDTHWSHHWKCEEPWPGHLSCGDFASLLGCCNTILHDIVTVAEVFCADLKLLDLIKASALPSLAIPGRRVTRYSIIGRATRRLQLILRLPYAIIQNVSHSPHLDMLQGVTDSALNQDSKRILSSWSNVCSSLQCFNNLEQLHITLDHDSPQPWHTIHERRLLSPLTQTPQSPDSNTISDVKVTVRMPYLHPWFESTDRHFLTFDDGNMKIIRFERQRWFIDKRNSFNNKTDKYTAQPELQPIILSEDFPHMYKECDQWELPQVELIAAERDFLAQGVDVGYHIAYQRSRIEEGPNWRWWYLPPGQERHSGPGESVFSGAADDVDAIVVSRPPLAEGAMERWREFSRLHHRQVQAFEDSWGSDMLYLVFGEGVWSDDETR